MSQVLKIGCGVALGLTLVLMLMSAGCTALLYGDRLATDFDTGWRQGGGQITRAQANATHEALWRR